MSQWADERRGRRVVGRPLLQRGLLPRPPRPDVRSPFSSLPGTPAPASPPGGPAPSDRPAVRTIRLVAPPTDPELDRTADRIGSFIALLAVLMTLWSATFQWAGGQLTGRDALMLCAALPVSTATAAWARLAVRRHRTARPALIAHTLVCLLQLVIAMPLWQLGPGRAASPLVFTVELGAAAAWTCLSAPAAIADIIVTSLLVVVPMRDAARGPTILGDAAALALLGIVFTLTWRAVVAVVAMSRRAGETSWRSSANLMAAREAEAASNHWDGLIHDCVLNALGAVAHLPPAPGPSAGRPASGPTSGPASGPAGKLESSIRIMACDALSALHRSDLRNDSADVAEQLAGWAAGLGLQVDWDLTGTPPPGICEEIVRACAEALTNVARHSGAARARVTGRFSSGHAELNIRDEGRGFDPTQVPEVRRGLRTSVVGAMQACGGRARVVSAPGRGTTVSLAWDAPDIGELDYSQLRTFGPVAGLFILILTVILALGLWQRPDVVSPAVQAAGAVLILGATIVSIAWPRLHRWMLIAIPAVVIASQVAMLANLRHPATASWQEWFLGFSLGMYSALAWRTGSGIWLRISLLSWPVVTIGAAFVSGADPLVVLVACAPSFMWPAITAMASAWASNSLYERLASIRSSQGAAMDAARLQARAEAARREAERRLATIEGAPMEMLVYLAAGEPITDRVRRECRLLEASTRDLLVAPLVVDATMSECFRAARERDAVVSITGTDAAQGDVPWTGAAEAFRQACVILADAAGPGSRLTCRWHPRSAISRATVGLSAADPGFGAPGHATPDGASGEAGSTWPLARLEKLRASGLAELDIMDAGPDILATIT